MAIGNLFLGAAKKTIGDIVLYRRNGVQQSRVRVRHIANPKTEAQALQRNYMAPVTKFYAPLAGVLERSWEGLNRSESLSAFLKANFKLARANGWYVDKGTEFLALPYQVSKGILAPLTYSYNVLTLASTPNDIQVSTISAILVNMGYQLGDQITFVGCVKDTTKGDIRPVWSRFLLSDSDTAEIFADINEVVTFQAAQDSLEIAGVAEELIACTFIVSRWDGSKWLRSTQFVKCNEEYLQTFTSPEARAAAIASYRGGDSVVSSDIYLNGGSGSAESAGSDIYELWDSNSKTRIGYCRMIAISKNDIGAYVHASVENVANGEVVEVLFMNNIPSNPNRYNCIYRRNASNWYYRSAASYELSRCVPYLGPLGDVKLHNWLVNNGVNL